MTQHPPLWLDNGASSTYPAGRWRTMHRAMWPREGTFGPTELTVSQRGAGANLSVDVSAGRGIVHESSVSDPNGWRAYYIESDAVVNVPLTAAPGSNSRYDVVYAIVRDDTVGGANNDWVYAVAIGTASASPVEPAIPEQALRLGRVVRTAGDLTVTNAMCKDRRMFVHEWYDAQKVTISSMNLTTSLQPDAQLRLYLGANTFHAIDGWLKVLSEVAADILIGFTFPTGCVIHWSGTGAAFSIGAADTTDDGEYKTVSGTGSTAYGTFGLTNRAPVVIHGGIKMGDEAGLVILNWCQFSSNASLTYMTEENTYLSARAVRQQQW